VDESCAMFVCVRCGGDKFWLDLFVILWFVTARQHCYVAKQTSKQHVYVMYVCYVMYVMYVMLWYVCYLCYVCYAM
jgi:hypothetical protein